MRPDYINEAERISKMLPPVRQVRDSESHTYGGLGERSGISTSSSLVERPLLRPDEILSMKVDRVIIPGHAKPIDARRPGWEHWLPLCDPKPKAMEPNPVVEFLPTRSADGKYLDMPPETVPRNPWSGIKHPVAPPAPPPPPPEEPEETGPVGIGGKPFDWKWERENVTPARRTKCYPEPIGPIPAPKSAEQPVEETEPVTVDVDDFDLV